MVAIANQTRRAEGKITVVFGNHEQRIENTISEHLIASWQLRPGDEDINAAPSLSVARLLSLEKLNIESISSYPNGELWLNGHIRAIHGSIARKASLDTARNVILENNTTTIMGHIHRIELASRTFHDSTGERTIYAFCPGCLCRTDGGVPRSVHPQWQQGLGVIQYTETDITHITAVTIGGRSAIYNHKEYKANPDIQAIEKETNWRLT